MFNFFKHTAFIDYKIKDLQFIDSGFVIFVTTLVIKYDFIEILYIREVYQIPSMRTGTVRNFTLLIGTTTAVLGLSLLLAFSHTENVSALDEDGYVKFTVSKVNESNTNNLESPDTMPIPDSAKGPSIPSKGYLVGELGDNLYSVTDGAYNTMFMVTDKGVVAVDAPPSLGQKYLKAIAEVTSKPINYLIYSHAHIDHIGAAGLFPKNVSIIAQEETARELQRAKSVAKNATMIPPIPTITFSNNYTLSIGNEALKLDYYGSNHLPGNIFIYAPKQKVLMLVDIVFPGWIPFPYLAIAKDAAGFIDAHDIALDKYDFDKFVGGHLTRLGTKNDVAIQKEFIDDLKNAATKANQQVIFSEIAQQVGRFDNPWLIFSKYIDAVNEKCTQLVLPKWENKLGGAREFMSTHCFTMSEAERVDPTLQALTQNNTFIYK